MQLVMRRNRMHESQGGEKWERSHGRHSNGRASPRSWPENQQYDHQLLYEDS